MRRVRAASLGVESLDRTEDGPMALGGEVTPPGAPGPFLRQGHAAAHRGRRGRPAQPTLRKRRAHLSLQNR